MRIINQSAFDRWDVADGTVNGKEKQCAICGKLFVVRCFTSRQKYCSVLCKAVANQERKEIRSCSFCKSSFSVWPSLSQKYCSRICYRKALIGKHRKRAGVIKSCVYCKKEFYVPKCESYRKFCSQTCYLLHRYKKIKPHYVCKICGIKISKKLWNKKYCSMKCRNTDPEFHLWKGGEQHHSWKGGITPENEKARKINKYKEWQQSVFIRDNYVCQKCGKKGYLHAHHIKSFAEYPQLRYEIGNGITLCIYCHQRIHPNIKGIISRSENLTAN